MADPVRQSQFPWSSPVVSTHGTPGNFDETLWIEEQVNRYGPVVGGSDLRSLLGFRTAAAFQKARLQGQLEVLVFTMRGRQGMFAVTQEACRWVLAQRQLASARDQNRARPAGKEGA